MEQILSEITFVVAFAQTDCSSSDPEDASLDWDNYNHQNYYNLHTFDNNNQYYFSMSMSSSQSLCSDYGDYDKYALDGEHVHYNADDRYHEDVEGVADDDHGDVEGVADDDHEDVEGDADDDRGDAKDNDETDDSLDDLNIAERVRLGRRSSLMKAAPISISTTSRECSTTSPEGSMSSSWTSAPKQAISLNDKSITLISRIAPNDVFSMRKSRRRRMKRMMNTIHPELKSVFKLSGPTAWTVWTGATSARPCWDTRCW